MAERIDVAPPNGSKGGLVKWIKRLGFAGFMLFLIKGLLWLIVPAFIAWYSLKNN